ncbi:MAG: (d)CMP kinase [Pseudomonadota bacterium]
MADAARIITIDGPSGAGKGTVAASLARILGWHLLDSGALYRVTGLLAQRRGVDLADAQAIAALAAHLPVQFRSGAEGLRIELEGDDVSNDIRTESCGDAASRVAALVPVRNALIERQRAFAVPPGLVADGRDMGTAIFPDASLKIFLTASAEERANRRYKQLKDKNFDVSLVGLLAEIEGRDSRDSNRAANPLAPARDAIIIDSTVVSADDVIAHILELKSARIGIGA